MWIRQGILVGSCSFRLCIRPNDLLTRDSLIGVCCSTGSSREFALRPLAPQLGDKDQIEGYHGSADAPVMSRNLLQGVFQVLVYLHYCGLVATPVTVVGCCTGCQVKRSGL